MDTNKVAEVKSVPDRTLNSSCNQSMVKIPFDEKLDNFRVMPEKKFHKKDEVQAYATHFNILRSQSLSSRKDISKGVENLSSSVWSSRPDTANFRQNKYSRQNTNFNRDLADIQLAIRQRKDSLGA